MSEEEIIDILKNKLAFDEYEWFLMGYDDQTRMEDLETIENARQGLLDLYNEVQHNYYVLEKELVEEKEKNKKLEKYKQYYETEKVLWRRKNYISKDKIREILNKYDEQSEIKNIYWYEIEKDLQELLGE